MIKYSKTALMYLSHEYSHILKKCALLNAALLMSTMVALPANASSERVVVGAEESKTITENLTGIENTDNGGAVQNKGTVTVDEGVSFENEHVRCEYPDPGRAHKKFFAAVRAGDQRDDTGVSGSGDQHIP